MHHGFMALPIDFGNLWLSNTQEPILNTWINTTSEESFDIQSEQYCDECLTLIKQGIFSSSHCTQVKAKCFSRGSFHRVTQGDSAPNKYQHTIHLLSSIIEITWIPWFNGRKVKAFCCQWEAEKLSLVVMRELVNESFHWRWRKWFHRAIEWIDWNSIRPHSIQHTGLYWEFHSTV